MSVFCQCRIPHSSCRRHCPVLCVWGGVEQKFPLSGVWVVLTSFRKGRTWCYCVGRGERCGFWVERAPPTVAPSLGRQRPLPLGGMGPVGEPLVGSTGFCKTQISPEASGPAARTYTETGKPGRKGGAPTWNVDSESIQIVKNRHGGKMPNSSLLHHRQNEGSKGSSLIRLFRA